MLKRVLIPAFAALAVAAGGPAAADMMKAPPGGDYKKVSSLVALPDFLPGLGTLYVQPATLPAGPFLAYDKSGRLASTIYMVPLADMNGQKTFDDLSTGGAEVKHVDFHYNAGHPGVEAPHYHVILWHVDDEGVVAK